MGVYSISDLAELTGIKTHTLRVWEKRYGLLKPQRTDSNIRYYLDSDLKTLMMVANLCQHGYRISKVAGMTAAEMEQEYKRISIPEEDVSARLQRAVIDLDVVGMDAALDDAITKSGFESALLEVVLPMLEKMEVMWLSGAIDESHEACFREVIRRKTIREIDALPHNPNGDRVIMFLPHGNQQELSHLFMHYFIRRQGLCVTDIGCDIQVECACAALNKRKAECIVLVNADPVHWQFGPYIRKLVARTDLPIIISGRAAEENWSEFKGQVIVLDGIDETIQFVKGLKHNLQHSSLQKS